MNTSSRKKIILKTLKSHKTIWHPESTLVYKSRKERIVIGRFVDGEIIPLDSDAVELCKEWGDKFPPDESLITDDNTEQEGEQEDEQESEQESDNTEQEGQDDNTEQEGEQESEDDNTEQEGEQEGEQESEQEGDNTEQEGERVSGQEQVSEDTTQQEIVNNSNYEECFQNFLTKVKTMCNNNDSKLQEANLQLKNKSEELEQITVKYEAIKKKFSAMKSLFD